MKKPTVADDLPWRDERLDPSPDPAGRDHAFPLEEAGD
jgi:hypothetical protein